MIDNVFNTTGFHWWAGVVEDRMDPLMLGRCRVRILGYHTEDKSVLPTEDLPWAMPIQNITSAAVTGFGRSATGLLESSWVFGFFADGEDSQQPLILGSFAGIPQTAFYARMTGKGFTDPNDKYPLKDHMEEPDTNRLARNEKIDTTIVQDKRDTRRRNVVVAFQKSPSFWDQPNIPYNAKYPFNHVHFTESGHVLEMDDTVGNERLHMYHRTGTFVEIDSKGTMVRRVVGDTYEIFESNGFIFIRGKANVTVEGTINIYAMNDLNVQVDGNATVHAHKQMEFKSGGKMIFSAGDNVEFHSDKQINVHADENINVKSGRNINMGSKVKTTIAGPLTEVGALKMNGFSLTPTPPLGPTIGSIPVIPIKNPTEEIVVIGEALTPAQRQEIVAKKYQAEIVEESILSKEYVEVRETELTTNKHLSIPVPITENEIVPDAECQAGNRVVEFAVRDIGVVESRGSDGGGRNCGGKVGVGEIPLGTGPFGSGNPGRIDEMLRRAGYDNQSFIANGGQIEKGTRRKTGEGIYWCAAAVTDWWTSAGLPTPPKPSGGCKDWANWAKSKGLYSDVPEVGAVVLYGKPGSENHVGIVTKITDTTIETIEGNTSGTAGFERNGGGCFPKKIVNWKERVLPTSTRPIAFIRIPKDNCVPVPATTVASLEEENIDMKTFIERLRRRSV
jgi:hypothetical protein